MGKIKDLTGMKFGRLTVKEMDSERGPSRQIKWICECECGTHKSIIGDNLKSGATLSCGCLQKTIASSSLIGQKFGKLTVVEKTEKRTSSRGIVWLCRCECGSACEVSTNNLKQGTTMSCGCLGSSQGEFIIAKILEENGVDYVREYSFHDLVSQEKRPFRFDFAILNKEGGLSHLIEYDGEAHDLNCISGWNTVEKVTKQIKYDIIKEEYCKDNNIKLIRISYKKKDKIGLEDLMF